MPGKELYWGVAQDSTRSLRKETVGNYTSFPAGGSQSSPGACWRLSGGSKMIKPRRCAICQGFYQPARNDQKYCAVCSGTRKYYRPEPVTEKKCLQCGKMFKTRKGIQKFCSSLCRHVYHQSTKKRHRKTCSECSKEFPTGRSFQVYCSNCCYLMAKARRDHECYMRGKG